MQGTKTVHRCHWPTCTRRVPPKLWGCRGHWFLLPKAIREAIWAAYVPGQELSKTPSRAYLDAARKANEWALAYERVKAQKRKSEPVQLDMFGGENEQ